MGRGMRSKLSRSGAMIVAIAMCAIVPAFGPVATAATVQGATSTAEHAAESIDLDNPTAGISDPAAHLTPLDRNCAAGQVDVNSADAVQIGDAIGISSKPTLQRIVSGRPWLRSLDLVSVPGVGPSRAAMLREKLCAAPDALPPAVDHAPKAGFTGVDLQTATATQIADATRLSLPIARRLKAYGPLPDDLHQIAAPAVPGLSDPVIDRLLAAGNVAITPYPFSYQGKTWQWVSHDHGAVVAASSDSRYALIVPPDRVSGDGAWATVSAQPDEYGVLPSGDFHIYGAWTPEVAVQLPNITDYTASDETAIHAAADGPRISQGTGLAAGPVSGTTVAAMTSLSTVTLSVRSVGCAANQGYALSSASPLLWCQPDFRDGSLRSAFTSTLQSQFLHMDPSPGPCPAAGEPLLSVRGTMYGMKCTDITVHGATATATWKNASATPFWFGNVYHYQSSPSGVMTMHEPGTFSITDNLFAKIAADRNLIPPGFTATVDVAQGGGPVTSSVRTGGFWPPVFWITDQFTALLDPLFSAYAGSENQLIGCALGMSNDPDAATLMSCLSGVIKNASTLLSESDKLSKSTKVLVASAAEKANALGWIALGINLALSSVQWATQTGLDTVTYEFRNPAPPIGVGGGGLNGATADGKYIARVSGDGAAFLVDTTTQTAVSIGTSGDFNCYATGYFVLDDLTEYVGSDGSYRLTAPGNPKVLPGDVAATCKSMDPVWSYTPVADGGNVPNGVIVKMPDWLGRGSWWITPSGSIETIADGGTYQCLAAKAPVIYNFPLAKVDAWTPVGTTPASCP